MTIIQLDSDQLAKVIENAVEQALLRHQPQVRAPRPQPEEMRIEAASEFTGYSESYLYKLVSRREIPFKKYGKYVVFERSELEAWKEARRIKSATEIADALDEKAGKKNR